MKITLGKKRLMVFLLVLVLLFAFLYKYVLFGKVFDILQYRLDFLKDYDVYIQSAKGGIFSKLVLTNVSIKRKKDTKNEYSFLILNKLNLNVSLIDLIKAYLFRKNLPVNISLYNPTIYLTDKTISGISKENIPKFLSEFRQLDSQDFKLFNFSNIKIKFINSNLINFSSNRTIVKNFNADVIFQPKKIIFKNSSFEIFEFPIQLSGYISDGKRLFLSLSSGYAPFKFSSTVSGDMDNPRLYADVKLLNKFNYHINGALRFQDESVFLDDIYINNIYRIQGSYSHARRVCDVDIKRVLRGEKTLYFNDFSQLLNLNFNLSEYPKIYSGLKIERLALENLDYITNLYLEGEFIKDEGFKGKLYSQGSIFNYQPFYELTSEIKYIDKRLIIHDLDLEDTLKLALSVDFKEPYPVNLKLNTQWLDIGMMLNKFYPELLMTITGQGKLRLSVDGSVTDPYISGNITSKDGIIKNLEYILFECNFKGNKEWVELYNSKITQQDNYYNIYGGVPLTNINKPDFFKTVDVISDDEGFVWKGWSFLRKDMGEEVELEKRVGEDFKVGFNTYLEKEGYGSVGTSNGANGLELEYSLTEDKSLKLEIKDDEEVFGVQRSVKF